MEQYSSCFAWLYLVQDVEMPFCVGDGAAGPLPDKPDGGDVEVLVCVVELL